MRMRVLLFAAVLAGVVGPAAQTQRFDNAIREDFFAGMFGDMARFDRAMKACEDALATNPKNAAALVWHGAGLLVRSGTAFRAADTAQGIALRTRAMREINDAVAMAPDDVQVLIPRAAILLASARFAPVDQSRERARLAAADYEKVLAIEAPYAKSLGTHARGELLGGLATAYRLSGDDARAVSFLKRLTSELPDTPYARKARTWMADLRAVPRDDQFCLGCHSGPSASRF